MHSVLAFLSAHQALLITVALLAVPALITGLSRYPKAAGFVMVLQTFFDVFSVVVHADSPGTLKLPLTRSQPPLTPLVSVTVPPIGPVLVLLLAAGLLSGCDWDPIDHSPNFAAFLACCGLSTLALACFAPVRSLAFKLSQPAGMIIFATAIATQGCATIPWSKLLQDGEACAAQVAGQAIVSTINGVIASAETSIAGGNGFDSADWKNRGVALATSAGTSAVACAVAHLLGDLSGTIAGPVQPCHCQHAPVRPELKPYLEALYKRVAPRK
jgi:hypothetical protein